MNHTNTNYLLSTPLALLCAALSIAACDPPDQAQPERLRSDDPADGDGTGELLCGGQIDDTRDDDAAAPEDVVARYVEAEQTLLMLDGWLDPITDVIGLTWIDENHVVFADSEQPVVVEVVAEEQQLILVEDNREKGFRLYKQAKCEPWSEARDYCFSLDSEPGVYTKSSYPGGHKCKAGNSWCVEEFGVFYTQTKHSDKDCKGPAKPEPKHSYTHLCNPALHGN